MNLNPEYENKYLSLLKKIIMDETQHDASTIFLFGSRASGRERFGSDYDIGITGMDKNTFEKMKYSILDKIEDSIIPWKTDIVNFDTVTENFRESAMKKVLWWKKEPVLK
jgi:predicted nucleotidyltransferase